MTKEDTSSTTCDLDVVILDSRKAMRSRIQAKFSHSLLAPE
jgi:hypothetical protein